MKYPMWLCYRLINLFSKDKFYDWSRYWNNTISKTIIDLNKIVRYADKKWQLSDKVQRGYFIIADMIISWEKEWPVSPSPKDVWIIAMWDNPVDFDEAIWTLMWCKMKTNPTILCAKKSLKWNLWKDSRRKIISNNIELNNKTLDKINKKDILYFEPTSWRKNVFLEKKWW